MNVYIDCPDGKPQNTKITTESGEELRGVTAASFTITADGYAQADLAFDFVSLSGKAEATISEEALRELAESQGFELVPK